MNNKVYAQDTKVPVTQSHNEIHKMLTAVGADQIGIMFSNGDGSIIVFRINDVMYRFSQPALDERIKNKEQAERAAWRAMVLLVKAKKVAIEQGISTVEREFMADTVMPDGKTLEHHHRQIIHHNYQSGPPQLGFFPNSN